MTRVMTYEQVMHARSQRPDLLARQTRLDVAIAAFLAARKPPAPPLTHYGAIATILRRVRPKTAALAAVRAFRKTGELPSVMRSKLTPPIATASRERLALCALREALRRAWDGRHEAEAMLLAADILAHLGKHSLARDAMARANGMKPFDGGDGVPPDWLVAKALSGRRARVRCAD